MNSQKWKDMLADVPSVARKMSFVAFQMDMARDPEDALLDWKAGAERLEAYHHSHFALLVEAVAKKTGADPAQIADKDKRTEEQQQALLLEAGRLQVARLNHFFASNYMQAVNAIEGEKTEYDQPPAEGAYSLKELAVLYFFSQRPDITPAEKAALTDDDIAELKRYLAAFDRFYVGRKDDGTPDILANFIEHGLQDVKPESLSSARLDKLDYPLDKVNRTIWQLFEEHHTGGQIALRTQKHGSGEKVLIYYSVNFDEELLAQQGVKITKRLSPFDKRAYAAAGGLYAEKQGAAFTYTELYRAMGYTGKPGTSDLEKIATSITKMNGAHIYVNNRAEIAANYKYPRFVYDGSLLPMERISAIVNGSVTDAAVHLLREPPMLTFARDRKQITTIGLGVLQTPLSKTEANLALEDYMIERISEAKNKRNALAKQIKRRCRTEQDRIDKAQKEQELNAPLRIIYETIYENVGITTKMQKTRAPAKIIRLLSHYKQCGYISDFCEEKDGVTIQLQ